MEDCAVLLMLGTDFLYMQFFASHAKVVHIDLRGNNIGRRTKVDLGLVGSIKDTLSALLPLLETKTDRTNLNARTKDYTNVREGLEELARPDNNRTPITLSTSHALSTNSPHAMPSSPAM
jgi:pyruvate dehydrogenase (quinone)